MYQHTNPLRVQLETTLLSKLERFYTVLPLKRRQNVLSQEMDAVSLKLSELQNQYEEHSLLLDEELKMLKVLEPDFSITSLIEEPDKSLVIEYLSKLTELTENYAELVELFNSYQNEFIDLELEIISLQDNQYQLS